MKSSKHIITITLGWVLVGLAVLLTIFGVVIGIEEDREFYQRQADYHALDEEREALSERLDSLYILLADLEEQGDTLAATALRAEIESIGDSDEYLDLFGIPQPPQGFSMAYLVTILMCIVALIPLIIGIILLAVGYQKKHKSNKVTKNSNMK